MPEATVLLAVLAAGFLAGVASGLFGVGGGILMVPAAIYLVPGTDFHLAKAISLVVIVFSAGIGIWTHHKSRSVDFEAGLILAAGGFAGTAASVAFVENLQDEWLRIAFGLFLALTGVRLALSGTPKPREMTKRQRRTYLAGAGLVGGLLSGAFGVGGGILIVPALVFVGVGIHLAVGTSLVAVLGNAVSGTATHLAYGYGPALATLGLPLALGAIPGTRIGSKLAHRLNAERLKRMFGVFLVLIGLWMSVEGLL